MKQKLVLFALVCIFSGNTFSQQNTQDDIHVRIGMYLKLNPEFWNVKVTSEDAKSIVKIISETFEHYLTIPTISLNNLNSGEKSEIISLQNRLQDLLQNPPTWDQLVILQKQINSAPPTPPVYVGDEKANIYYNVKYYQKTRASSGKTPISSENKSSDSKTISIPKSSPTNSDDTKK